MRRLASFVLVACAAFAGPVAASGIQRTTAGGFSLEVAPGWSRAGDLTFVSPSGLTLAVLPALSDQDGDDLLESAVADIEDGDTIDERGEAEQSPPAEGDPDERWSRDSTVRTADGRLVRRLYVAVHVDAFDATGMAAVSGEPAAWAEDGAAARAMLASLHLLEPSAAAPIAIAPEALPGDGGLDGIYVRTQAADDLRQHWVRGSRTSVLVFGPLGEVVRRAPRRFDLAATEDCAAYWAEGRYRIERDEIVLRWCDGTSERLPFQRTTDGVQIGGIDFVAADFTGQPAPSGVYVLQDDFGAAERPPGAAAPPVLRFLDGGKLVMEGMTGYGPDGVQFSPGAATPARYRLKGRDLTIVYDRGASEVVGFAHLPSAVDDIILVGGLFFKRAD